MVKKTLDLKVLKQTLSYNEETGLFRWVKLNSRGFHLFNKIAGTLDKDGYNVIKIDGRLYRGARLAFLYMVGAMPHNLVDHINGVKNDDRWENLREVNDLENARNRRLSLNNSSGFSGVTAHKDGGWTARISGGENRKYLGYFPSKEKAVAARLAAEKELNYNA